MKEFQAPGGDSISGRQTAMRSLFVRSLIPNISPSDEEYQQALQLLGQKTETDLTCSYCGDLATEWDHFFPVMSQGKPTGYLTLIQNLVPACSKCNQSKGNRYWRDWIISDAPLSPKSREVKQLKRHISQLKSYESWGKNLRIDFTELLGKEPLHIHWENLENILAEMKSADQYASQLRQELTARLPEALPPQNQKHWIIRLLNWIFRK